MTGKENPESEIFELFDDNLLVAWTAVTGKENPENAIFEIFGAIGCVDGYDR